MKRWKRIATRHAEACKDGKAALALAASTLDAQVHGLTFRCVVPGMQVTDESPGAARYAGNASTTGSWTSETLKATPALMAVPYPSRSRSRPLQANFERLIFGETADVIYGGLDGLLSRDWLAGDFIERFAFVPAWKVLRRAAGSPMLAYERDGHIDPHEFISPSDGPTSTPAAAPAWRRRCPIWALLRAAGLRCDGESKYLVREMFRRLYRLEKVQGATNEWFRTGKATAPEFLPHCTDNMTGDQKWCAPDQPTPQEIKESEVFMGDFPLMTEHGTFIVNGAERHHFAIGALARRLLRPHHRQDRRLPLFGADDPQPRRLDRV